MVLVKDLTADSTIAVRGLDLQLFWQLNQLVPNSLVSIADLNINPGDGLFPYAQLSVRKALNSALDAYGKPLTVNSAYRSVIAQAMLYSQKQRGLIQNLVAYPGKSDHQKGASLDIDEWADVIDLMGNHGWNWTYGKADAMHFDCTSATIEDIRPDSIKAFQTLWNVANPGAKIAVDGALGDNTLNCIYNSPAEGFSNVGYPRTLKLTTPIQQGNDVGELQIALRTAGITLEHANQTFDLDTETAVKAFQQAKGSTADGVVGVGTRKLLGLES
jgi:peptidoglycan hydrolase-like protein with peptidoglycan-binding domain